MRFASRLNLLLALLAFGLALTLSVVAARVTDRAVEDRARDRLRREIDLLADEIGPRLGDPAGLVDVVRRASRLLGVRVTVIRADGRVLDDSDVALSEVAGMENHAGRPEFKAALSGSMGSDTRKSHTLGVDLLYVASPVPGGAVRLAIPLTAIAEANHKVWRSLWLASALAMLVAIAISAWVSGRISLRLKRIVQFAGHIAEGDLSARLSEYQNDELGLVANALDSTARKLQASFQQLENSRSELEAVLNSMQEPVIAISADGRTQWANRRMEMLTPTGVRLGQPVVQTVRDPNFLATVHEAAQRHKLITARVLSFVPGRVFAATVAPMPAGGSVAVFHDLTEAESIERTRRDFIANVSHELRTPLTSIQGYAETLLEGGSRDDTQHDFLEIIRKNAQRMARLTEDLLVLARVESGEKKLQLRPVSAADLLRDASDYFRDHGDSGMTLDIVNEALKLVAADRDAIFQVFSNLIDNACKYAAQGGRILIGAHDVEGFVQFYVRDFGPGIASEHLPRLFERFYRVDKARSRESGGTGLGLAIAKHIMLAHGGTITAESELNHGCTFVFSLPEARAPLD